MQFELDVYYPALNLISRERLDPLIYSLLRLAGIDWQPLYVAAQAAVAAAGFYWLAALWQRGRQARIFGAAAGAAGLLVCTGGDPFFFRMHWFPLFAAALVRVELRPGLRSWLLLVLVSAGFIWTAGTLAPFGAAAAAICAVVFLRGRLLPARGAGKATAVVFAAVAAAAVVLEPVYEQPAYPGGARLAPISPLLSYPPPLAGRRVDPPPMVYDKYLSELRLAGGRGLLLLPALAVLWLPAARMSSRLSPEIRELADGGRFAALLIGAGTLLLAAGELLIPHGYEQLAPFPAAARLVPGLAMGAAAWLLLPFGWTAAVGELLRAASGRQTAAFAAAVLLLAPAALLIFPPLAGENHFAALRRGPPGVERSPSGFVVRTVGAWAADPVEIRLRKDDALVRLRPGADYLVVGTDASPHPDRAPLAVDGNTDTFWTTGRPQQPGDYYRLLFDGPVSVARIVVSVRDLPADFPRGLRVSAGPDPEDVLFEQEDWLGPVYWTQDLFPYFGPQSHVIVDLAEEREIGELLFEQLGKDKRFSWSINQVRLYRFDRDEPKEGG